MKPTVSYQDAPRSGPEDVILMADKLGAHFTEGHLPGLVIEGGDASLQLAEDLRPLGGDDVAALCLLRAADEATHHRSHDLIYCLHEINATLQQAFPGCIKREALVNCLQANASGIWSIDVYILGP